jgi:HSP20 family protein
MNLNLKNMIPWNQDDRQLARRQASEEPVLAFQRRLNSLFDDFFGRSPLDLWPSGADGFAPRIDVSETGKEVRVSAELPGLDEKDVEVTVTGNHLSIKGEKKEEREDRHGDYWHSERSYGHFERVLELPEGLETDQTKATFKKGVLKVTIPKVPGAQSTAKKIELTEG